MSALPPPRRLITGHTASGAPDVRDDVLVPTFLPGGYAVTHAFTQEQFLTTPQQAAAGADTKVEHSPLPGGIVVRYLGVSEIPLDRKRPTDWSSRKDMAQGFIGEMHHFNELYYPIVISGQIEVHFPDGSKKDVGAGDLIVQLGNAHQWVNKSDQWARGIAVVLPLKEPVRIDGKGLDKALGLKGA
ncbi:hypothetical protein P7C73_g2817, partial [Tremellales sp. Uapishka_1]